MSHFPIFSTYRKLPFSNSSLYSTGIYLWIPGPSESVSGTIRCKREKMFRAINQWIDRKMRNYFSHLEWLFDYDVNFQFLTIFNHTNYFKRQKNGLILALRARFRSKYLNSNEKQLLKSCFATKLFSRLLFMIHLTTNF